MSESEHFLSSSLDNMKNLIDVNKVVGNPIITKDGRVIIPITEVKVCFLSGGGEYGKEDIKTYPFGGAAGGNITMNPTGFIVITDNDVKTVSINKNTILEDLLFKELPTLIKKMNKEKK